MPKATDPPINRDDTDFQDSDAPVDEGSDPAAGLAARLAGLELDAETLEMVMAALTADVCDHLDKGTT